MSAQRKVNNLRVGARITHFDANIDRQVEGTVQSVLSAQFTYVTDDGKVRFCMYGDQWDFLK